MWPQHDGMTGWLLICHGMNQFGSQCAYSLAYIPDPAQAASDRLKLRKLPTCYSYILMVLVVLSLGQW